MSQSDFSSRYRRELINLVLVVLIVGLISDILASSLAVYIPAIIFGIPSPYWLTLIIGIVTFGVIYTLILIPKTTHAIIYSNIMVDKGKKCVFASKYSAPSSQLSETLCNALKVDKSHLVNQIIEDLHNFKVNSLSFDLLEYLIIQYCLSGLELFWASKTIKSYGYPTHPSRLGEISHYKPSSIYFLKNDDSDTPFNLPEEMSLSLKNAECEYKDLRPIIKGNKIMEHFMGKTSLNPIKTPKNLLLVLPKGSEITIDRKSKENQRVIKVFNRYATIYLKITKDSIGLGLPYSVKIKEQNYQEERYFTTNFRIEISVSMSRFFSIFPRIEHYYAWTNLIFKRLVANFALSRKGILEEIEVP